MTTPAPPSALEYFADLPPAIQEQLVRIARVILGMGMSEKELARLALATGGGTLADSAEDDLDDAVATAELMSALATTVSIAEDLAGHHHHDPAGGSSWPRAASE